MWMKYFLVTLSSKQSQLLGFFNGLDPLADVPGTKSCIDVLLELNFF